MTQPTDEGAVVVTDVDSAAQLLSQRYNNESNNEAIEDDKETQDTESLDEEIEANEDENKQEEQEAVDEEEAARFESINQLAEAAGMEVDDFLTSIKGKVKIDGEELEVSLSEMKDGYQRESDYRKKTMQHAESVKSFEAEKQQMQGELKQQLEQTRHVFGIAQNELMQDYQSINWQELEKDNPQEFLLKRQQFADRKGKLDQAISQATQQAQQLKQKYLIQQEQAREKYLTQQNEALLSAIPEWSNNKTREKETTEVSDYLSSVGFQPKEIEQFSDHRFVVLARAAMKQTQIATKTDLAKKQVKNLPKLVKPSAQLSKNQSQQKKISELKAKAKRTGSVDDVAQLLKARGR